MIPEFYIISIRIVLLLGAITIIISNIKSYTKKHNCFHREKLYKGFLIFKFGNHHKKDFGVICSFIYYFEVR